MVELWISVPREMNFGVPGAPRVSLLRRMLSSHRTVCQAALAASEHARVENQGFGDYPLRDQHDGTSLGMVRVRYGVANLAEDPGAPADPLDPLASLRRECPHCQQARLLLPCPGCGKQGCGECVVLKRVCCPIAGGGKGGREGE